MLRLSGKTMFMKNRFAVLLLLATALNANAQSEDPQGKFSIGVVSSLDYCGVIWEPHDSLATSPLLPQYLNYGKTGFGFTAGITSQYKLSSLFYLTGGIRYSLNRYTSGDLTFTDGQGNTVGTGFISYHNRFISVPVGLQLKAPADKFFGFTGGIAAIPEYALGIWSRGHYDLPPEYNLNESFTKDNSRELRQFMFSGSANAGVFLHLGELELQLVATGKYGFTQQAVEAPINRRLWSTGFELRMLYTI
jgi:hypothetical protein